MWEKHQFEAIFKIFSRAVFVEAIKVKRCSRFDFEMKLIWGIHLCCGRKFIQIFLPMNVWGNFLPSYQKCQHQAENSNYFQIIWTDHVLMKEIQGYTLYRVKNVPETWLSVNKIKKKFCQFSHLGKSFLNLKYGCIWWFLWQITEFELFFHAYLQFLDKNTPNQL